MDAIGKSDMQSEEEMENLKRGPWTLEEDFALINYISNHGEGRWNSLSRCAGLKRTGKSCRLRWLNYLRPDVRRGNITLEEQLIILELHSRWGNRWSKIAQHLPGRTDNEIKNYWRTRVQKHAKQLKCDVNSKQFKDTMRYVWMPRLVERIQAAAVATATTGPSSTATAATSTTTNSYDSSYNNNNNMDICNSSQVIMPNANMGGNFGGENIINQNFTPDNTSSASDLTDCYNYPVNHNDNYDNLQPNQLNFAETLTSPSGYFNQAMDFQPGEPNNPCFVDGGDLYDNLWNVEDIWLLQQQFSNNI